MLDLTNIRIVPSNDTIKQIMDLADCSGLPHADFDAHPHCTIIYSPDFINFRDIKLPTHKGAITGDKARFEIFDTKDDGYVLVIEFDCPFAKKCFDYMKSKYNIKTKYNEYRAHITLQKNISDTHIKLPKIDFDLFFDRILVTNSDDIK